METYTILRQLADSWALLLMFGLFLGIVFWAFRPGSAPVHRDAATSIFRNDARPARDADASQADREARK